MPQEKIKEENIPQRHNNYHKIIFTQLIFCVLIIFSVLIIKLLSASVFEEIKEFYIENFCDKTSTSEVLDVNFFEEPQ